MLLPLVELVDMLDDYEPPSEGFVYGTDRIFGNSVLVDTAGGGSDQSPSAAGGSAVLDVVGGGRQTIEPPSFVEPTLVSWGGMVTSTTGFAAVTLDNNVTGGTACTIQFKIEYDPPGRDFFVFTSGVSAPEQNSPHLTLAMIITEVAARGNFYDLYWRWWSGAESGAYQLVANDAIYVPQVGEPDQSLP